MKVWLNRLVFAIQFMTRIPIRANVDVEREELPRIAAFFPVVGLCVGAFSALLAWAAHFLGYSLFTSAAAVLGSALITGGLHIDGLCDSFDALGSSRTRDQMLEIMKDSRLGTMGGIALVFDILLKVLLYSRLSPDFSAFSDYLLIAAVPIAGRLMLCTGTTMSKCARPGGMGSLFIDGMGWPDLIRCSALTFALLLAFAGFFRALSSIVLLPLAGWLVSALVSKKLGGITGDTMGMLNELGELLFLITAIAGGAA